MNDRQWPDNKVPNLDCMGESELMEFWAKYNRAGRNDTVALLGGGGKGSKKAVKELAAYAINKSVAMGLRSQGKIGTALQYEAICEACFARLPRELRW